MGFMADWLTSRLRRVRSQPRPRHSVPTVTTRPSRAAAPSPKAGTRTGISSATRRPRRIEAPVSGDPRFRRKLLGHEHPGGAGGLAGNAAELAPTVPLVKARCLEADGVEHAAAAAALARLGLRHRQHAAAEAAPSDRVRQENQIDEEKPQRRPAEKAAEHL